VVPGEVRGCHPQQGPSKHLVIIDSHQMSCPLVLQFKFNLCTMNCMFVGYQMHCQFCLCWSWLFVSIIPSWWSD
jgi:hypothetical protein